MKKIFGGKNDMSKLLKNPMVWIMALAVCLCAAFLFTPAVYADTDGTELQVTDQPEKLVIQLGTAWAGVEFELKTDAGLYPQPVVVSAEGVLSMELGGSKTYTLSAMNSPNSAPDPDAAASAVSQDETTLSPEDDRLSSASDGNSGQTDNPEPSENPEQTDNQDDNSQSVDEQDNNLIKGIPNMHLFLFAGGLIGCVAGLVVMWVMKRRKSNRYDDSDDYDDDEEDD